MNNNIYLDYDKVRKVIDSCNDTKYFAATQKYLHLFFSKWSNKKVEFELLHKLDIDLKNKFLIKAASLNKSSSNKQKSMKERLENFFNNMSEEEAKNMYEKITHESFYTRWIERIHKLSIEDRSKIIDKVIIKYSSKEYKEREYKCGREPEERLFALLFKYAEKYGEQTQESQSHFPELAYKIDNMYFISLMQGQGCSYKCYKL